MDFHCSWRAGFYAYTAGKAFIVVEVNMSGYRVKLKGAGGADGDTGTTIGTPCLIAGNVLAERLDLHPGFEQKVDAPVVFFLVSLELQHH